MDELTKKFNELTEELKSMFVVSQAMAKNNFNSTQQPVEGKTDNPDPPPTKPYPDSQQPKAQPTEFTKNFRELIKLSEEHLSDNKIGRLQTYGKEACKIIEKSEARCKGLMEALKAEHDDCALVNGAESCAICDLISNAKAEDK